MSRILEKKSRNCTVHISPFGKYFRMPHTQYPKYQIDK